MELTRDQKLVKQKSELSALQEKQRAAAAGDASAMEYTEANRNPKYKIRSIESEYVHVRVVTKHLNESEKKYNSEELIVKIHAREFGRRVLEGAFSTYDEAEVIHDPRKNAPQTYDLKPNQLAIDSKGPNDNLKASPNVAAREKELSKKEAELAERERRLADLESKLAANATTETDASAATGSPEDQETQKPKGKK